MVEILTEDNFDFTEIEIEPHYSDCCKLNNDKDLYRYEFYLVGDRDQYDDFGQLLPRNKCIIYFAINKSSFQKLRHQIANDDKHTIAVKNGLLVINGIHEFSDFQLIDNAGEDV